MASGGIIKRGKLTIMREKLTDYAFALLRLSLGWIFLWPFADKLWGLGFATTPEQAWVNGGSPTTGFLSRATRGPLAEYFQALAGWPLVDWLFIVALLLIGLALILGVGVRIAAAGGATLLVLIWLATLPPPYNPFLDEHIIYSLALVAVALVNDRQRLGLGRRWQRQFLVKSHPVLQ